MKNNNAQNWWKFAYRKIHSEPNQYASKYALDLMWRYRREAALERALAAANRRIEAQAQRIEELEALLTGMSRMVEQRDRILSDHDARLLEQWHERM